MYRQGPPSRSIEPVVGDESDPYAIREEDLPQIFDEYDKLARYIIEKDKKGEGFNFFHFMIDLEGGPRLIFLAEPVWEEPNPCQQVNPRSPKSAAIRTRLTIPLLFFMSKSLS